MTRRTPLYACHIAAGAKIVPFAGWEMPIDYGSIVEEHHHVRRDAGVFDVSHMTIVDVHGAGSEAFLRYLLANDVTKLQQSGDALYSCLLAPDGGVLDDLIVYRLGTERYRVVVNAATREKDLAWIAQQVGAYPSVRVEEQEELAMIAIQGPMALDRARRAFTGAQREASWGLRRFAAVEAGGWLIARTGYTGEDGFEVICPAHQAVTLWNDLLAQGLAACGLGARDTLRLEAGLNLYGHDMTAEVSPLESNLGWTIAWQPESRDFIGRAALTAQRVAGVKKQLVGLVLTEPGVLREGQKVICQNGEGIITSGTFSPTFHCGVGLARVPVNAGLVCEVEVRQKRLSARIVKPPFIKDGQKNF